MNTEASSAAAPPASSAAAATTIAAIHEDVLRAHVLTRLDGPALASAACASSQLRSLSSERDLWANMCRSTWPSTSSPLVSRVISTFPDGPRSFFSDSYSLLAAAAASPPVAPGPGPSRLISAVDIRYRGDLIFSRAVETDADSGWFQCSPFRIDVLDPKDAVRTAIRFPDAEQAGRELGEGLRLSWVLIDPAGRRAMDLSSQAPVSVQRHWLTGELHARFATVVEAAAGGERGTATEAVQCGVVVTCGGWAGAAAASEEEEGKDGGGGMQVREVGLQVEDGDGMHLSGRDSLEVLGRAFGGRRRGRREREEGERRRRYEEFERRKRERKERKLRTEGTLDFLFVGFGVLAFALFWLLVLCR
ncbi:probable F-box protein At2g36090 [Syzygium oleosum]|uniref:probable F-box protein At2g36090 n=1 Tax=Syzygium oleosum TaxID=219896 RepID=UPI0011D1EEA7|nr:probable F-box protein At2g36090 [Syzygium oleosum]